MTIKINIPNHYNLQEAFFHISHEITNSAINGLPDPNKKFEIKFNNYIFTQQSYDPGTWTNAYIMEIINVKEVYQTSSEKTIDKTFPLEDTLVLGEHLSKMAQLAINQAIDYAIDLLEDNKLNNPKRQQLANTNFVFSFNEIDISFNPFKTNAAELICRHMDAKDILNYRYKNSKEYKDRERARKELIKKYQDTLNKKSYIEIINIQESNLRIRDSNFLPEYMILVLYWLFDIAYLSSQQEVEFHNRDRLMQVLMESGIHENTHIKLDYTKFDTKSKFNYLLDQYLSYFKNPNQEALNALDILTSSWIEEHFNFKVNLIDRIKNQLD